MCVAAYLREGNLKLNLLLAYSIGGILNCKVQAVFH